MVSDDGTTLTSAGATRSNLYLKATSNAYYGQLAFTNGTNASYGGLSYNNSGQYMQFETNSSEWMRLGSTGNLLIGTTTDSGYKFDVTGTGRFTGDLTLSGASGNRTLNIQTNTSGDAILALTAAGSDGGTITYKRSTSEMIFGNSSASSALKIASTGAATFSSSVFVNGAFSTSNAAMTIAGPSAAYYNGLLITTNSYTSGSSGTYIRLGHYANSGDTAGIIDVQKTGGTANGNLSLMPFGGNVGIGTTSPNVNGLSTALTINGASTSGLEINANGVNQGYLIASTSLMILNARTSIPLLFYTADTERMRITSSGNVVIGDTSSINGASLGLKSTVATQQPLSIWNSGTGASIWFIEFETGTTITARGSITYNGTNVLYNATSDYRLKKDLKDFSGLEKLSQIKVYDFLWKDTEIRDKGVLAHELAEVLPLAVTGEKDGEKMQGVDYSKLVPILIKAIQEQQDIINELKADIELLKNK